MSNKIFLLELIGMYPVPLSADTSLTLILLLSVGEVLYKSLYQLDAYILYNNLFLNFMYIL